MDSQQAVERLEILLKLVAHEANADRAAVYVPRNGSLALVVQMKLDQAVSDLVLAAWASHRPEFNAAKTVRYGTTAIRPLFQDGRLMALVFLNKTSEQPPTKSQLDVYTRMLPLIERAGTPSPIGSYLACGLAYIDAARELDRDHLAIVLSQVNGNVAAAARRLGVCRATVYLRAERTGLVVSTFRLGRRRLAT